MSVKIFLLAQTQLGPDFEAFCEHVGWDNDGEVTKDGDLLVEAAGRLCYKSWKTYDGTDKTNPNVLKVREGNADYISNIIESGHGSVLEHVNFTFACMGVSRVFTHEIVRHRAGCAFSQESLRYVRLQDLELVMPGKDELASLHRGVVGSVVEDIREAIVSLNKLLIEDNEDKSFAWKKKMTSLIRRVAPMGISTNIIFTANARALRHLIVQRTSVHAEIEIRLVFDEIAKKAKAHAPAIFADLTKQEDGSYTSPQEKV